MSQFDELVQRLCNYQNDEDEFSVVPTDELRTVIDAIDALTTGIPVVELRGRDVSTVVLKYDGPVSQEIAKAISKMIEGMPIAECARFMVLDGSLDIKMVFHDATKSS